MSAKKIAAKKVAPPKKLNRYGSIILEIFRRCQSEDNYVFPRKWIPEFAKSLDITLPDNQGDILYSFRFRTPLPIEITELAPADKEWIIELAGKSNYRFSLVSNSRLVPRSDLVAIKIPDATPEIVMDFALGDEQALLAIVRYNRLIDIFLGLTTYSLQNHLRTSIKMEEGRTQIEIDELYVGLNASGNQFVIPVQAKGGSDKLSPVQAFQDIEWCMQRFPDLPCRSVSAQFMADGRIGMMELVLQDGDIRVAQERQYRLVAASEIDRQR